MSRARRSMAATVRVPPSEQAGSRLERIQHRTISQARIIVRKYTGVLMFCESINSTHSPHLSHRAHIPNHFDCIGQSRLSLSPLVCRGLCVLLHRSLLPMTGRAYWRATRRHQPASESACALDLDRMADLLFKRRFRHGAQCWVKVCFSVLDWR